MPADPREACAFGACLENRSVFILDPRLNVVPTPHYCAWPVRFGSCGPSPRYVTENVLAMKA